MCGIYTNTYLKSNPPVITKIVYMNSIHLFGAYEREGSNVRCEKISDFLIKIISL